MAITILPPAPAATPYDDDNTSSDSDDGGVDIEGDFDMRPKKRARHQGSSDIVTPGEIVTDDPQWMRGHGTHIPPNTTTITSTISGTVLKTNKLLSIRPFRARYTPEIGDLVVGRILEVQPRRWRVDIASPLLAALPLSAINLPGGIQRKRTETDELQMRAFFSEGDLLVCEVQSLFQDGSASLHTRSLKYGKLRNGFFLAVSGTGGTRAGGGGAVVRSRRQAWTLEGANAAGTIDVILGVNGYIWISKHDDAADAEGGNVSITRLEESTSSKAYSSQNDEISPEARREIARITGVITCLVEAGLRIDEDMVMNGYKAALEVALESDDGKGSSGDYLGGEQGKRVVRILTGSS